MLSKNTPRSTFHSRYDDNVKLISSLMTGNKHAIQNKCREYVLPSLCLYEDFNEKLLTEAEIKACGVMDFNWYKDNNETIIRDFLFLLAPSKPDNNRQLEELLKLEAYEDFYKVDDKTIMLILHLPVKGICKKFLNGEYSKMYTEEQLDVCFNRTNNQIVKKDSKYGVMFSMVKSKIYTHQVLTRDEKYFDDVFSRIILKDFDYEAKYEDTLELDYAPRLSVETFNFDLSFWKWINKEE